MSGALEGRIRDALTPFICAPPERFDAAVAAVMRAVNADRGPEVVRMGFGTARLASAPTEPDDDEPRNPLTACPHCNWYGDMHAPSCSRSASIALQGIYGVRTDAPAEIRREVL